MPLSQIFDIHLILGSATFFLLGFVAFPRINHTMTKKMDEIIWLAIVAPVIGIACIIFGGALIFIARNIPDEIIVQIFWTYFILFVVALFGYAWHIISPGEPNDIEQNIKQAREAIDQVIELGEYNKEKYQEIQHILNGDK